MISRKKTLCGEEDAEVQAHELVIPMPETLSVMLLQSPTPMSSVLSYRCTNHRREGAVRDVRDKSDEGNRQRLNLAWTSGGPVKNLIQASVAGLVEHHWATDAQAAIPPHTGGTTADACLLN